MEDNKVAFVALGVALLGLIFPRPSNSQTIVSASNGTTAVGSEPSPHRSLLHPPTLGSAHSGITSLAFTGESPCDRTMRITFHSDGTQAAGEILFRVTFGGLGGVGNIAGYQHIPNPMIQDISGGSANINGAFPENVSVTGFDVITSLGIESVGNYGVLIAVVPTVESFD